MINMFEGVAEAAAVPYRERRALRRGSVRAAAA